MKKQLLILMTLFTAVTGYSQTFTDTNFIEYTISSTNTVEVTGYDVASGGTDLDIPATVDYNSSTYNVTSIGQAAFISKGLTSVIMPNSINAIGNGAFNFNQLTNLSIPNGITTINDSAFKNNLLMMITIPSSVTSIQDEAFRNNSLVDISIPNSVTNISSEAFASNQLTSVTIPNSIITIGARVFQNNQLNCVISEAITPPTIITGGTNDTFHSTGDRSNIDLSIPSGTASAYATAQWTGFNSVTAGLSGSFVVNNITYQINATPNNEVTVTGYNAAGGSIVNIPDTVNSACTTFTVIAIGNYAFNNKSLTDVTIPDSVETIGDGAFLNNSISNLVLSSSLINTGNFAFRYNSLVTLNIPNSVTAISEFSFANNNIVNLTISDNVITINNGSFFANNITNLVLGSNVETIGDFAFPDNNNLTSVIIPDSVLSIGDSAFQSCDITNLVLGNSVTTIGDEAFIANPQLTSIKLPSSVTSIGEGAFKDLPLTDVISLATTPPAIITTGVFATDTFGVNRGNINLVILNSTSDAYITITGALWTGFKMVFEETNTTTNTLKVADYNSASGTSVSIPATITDGSMVYNVTEIGDSAFISKGLTNVTIPDGVISIGASAFETNSLTSVTIPDSVISIGSQAFVTNNLNNLIIGNNVTTIELGAFVDNDLTDITIPSSVTNIGSLAFAANPLTSVTSLATTPSAITTGTNDTFNVSGDRSGIHLHIPPGTLDIYVTNPNAGADWTGFNPVTEDTTLSTSNFELVNEVTVITKTDELEVISSGSARLKNYTIYSITGAKIKEGKESTTTTNTLSKGIYILKLDFDKGTVVKKVVVN